MPTSAFRRLLNSPKIRDSFAGFYVLVGSSVFLSLLHLLTPPETSMGNMEAQLGFSLSQFKEFKLWTLFTHCLIHNNVLELVFSVGSILFLSHLLKKFYSGRELARIFVLSSLAEGLSHALIGPGAQMISGTLGIALTFLILYTPLSGNTPLFYLGSFPVNASIVTAAIVLANLFTLGLPWRPDHSSFAGHMGILIFSWIALRKSLAASLYSSSSPFGSPFGPSGSLETHSPASSASPSENSSQQTPSRAAPFNPSGSPSIEKQVDAILEKISEKGIDSLSDKERGILDKASKAKKQMRS